MSTGNKDLSKDKDVLLLGGQGIHNNQYGTLPSTPKVEVRSTATAGCCQRVFPAGFKTEFKAMFKLTWPMVLTMFSQNFIPAVAVMFSGQLNRTALNAVSLANSIINVTGLSVGMGLATACDTLFSQSFGSSNKKQVGLYLQKALLIIIIACLPCWAIHLNTESILRILGQEEETARIGGRYILYYMPALLFNFSFQVLSKYIQNQNIVLPNVIIGLLAVGLNAGLHYVFLFVINWGTDGSAICQVIANFTACALTLLYILVTGVYKETWGGWSIDCLQNWWVVLKLAIPGMLMICLEWWCFEIGTLLSGLIKEGIQLGAQSIMFQLEAIGFMIPMGISIAVSIRVGQHLGAGYAEGAKTACHMALLIGVTCSLIIGILFMALRYYIPQLFSQDVAVIEAAANVLPILGLFTILDGIAGINGGILRGCGRQVVGAVAIFIGLYVIALPLGIPLLLLTPLQVAGLWWAYCAGMLVEAILLTILMATTNWELEAKQAQVRAGIIEDDLTTEDEEDVMYEEDKSQIPPIDGNKQTIRSHVEVIPEDQEHDESRDTIPDEKTELLGPKRLPRPERSSTGVVPRRFSTPNPPLRRVSSSGGRMGRRYSSSRFVSVIHGRRFSSPHQPNQRKLSLPTMSRRYSSPYIAPVQEIVIDTEHEKLPVWKVVLLRIFVLIIALGILVAGALISVFFRFPYSPKHGCILPTSNMTTSSTSIICNFTTPVTTDSALTLTTL